MKGKAMYVPPCTDKRGHVLSLIPVPGFEDKPSRKCHKCGRLT